MKFSIFLCLYPVDHAYNECLLTSTCASQLTSRIFQKLKDLNDVGVLMQKCIFSALPRSQPSLLKGFVLRFRVSRCRAFALKWIWNCISEVYWNPETCPLEVFLAGPLTRSPDKSRKFRSRLCSRGLFSAFVCVVAERSWSIKQTGKKNADLQHF